MLAFVFWIAVYRAKTQTIGHDEALEYEWFLDGGVAHVLSYNPANHVLFTLLAKPIVWALGVSEFTLRLPSLLGAALYLFAGYLLSRKLFGDGVLLLFSLAMLCLNPQVADFMPAARGYILGLACLVVAMYAMARAVERGQFHPGDSEWRWGCAIASVSLALSVAASFTNVVPAACLVLTFSVAAMGGLRPFLKIADNRLQQFAKHFLVPGSVVGFCILWPFLIQWRLAPTTTNFDKASDALRDIFSASFLYKWTDDVFNSLGAVASAPGSWQERVTHLGEYVLLPGLFAFVTVGFFLAWRDDRAAPVVRAAACRVFAGAALGSILLIAVLHFATHIDYPFSRYCLFVIPLFTVGSLLAARQIHFDFPLRLMKVLGFIVVAIVISDYALSLQTRSFRYNAYDVISRDLFEAIANDASSRGLTNVRVGGTWWYEPEINFYRRRYKASWMLEFDIKDHSYWWQTPNSLVPADYNYFVFRPEGDPGLSGLRVRTIFRDNLRKITIVAIEK